MKTGKHLLPGPTRPIRTYLLTTPRIPHVSGVLTAIFNDQRRNEVAEMRRHGVSAFSSSTLRDTSIAELRDRDRTDVDAGDCWIAGRITRLTETSNYLFSDITDRTGTIQLFADTSAVDIPELEYLRVGDVVEATGPVIETDSGETSVDVSDLRFLSKALRHVSFDESLSTSRRRADRTRALLTADLRDVLETRFEITRVVRSCLDEWGYDEVTTPVIQSTHSGGSSRPFVVTPDLDGRRFLRATMEIEMKGLIAGGYDRVFQIGQIFRNEGIDRKNHPIKSILELYETFADYDEIMDLTERLLRAVFDAVDLGPVFEYDGTPVDISAEWPRLPIDRATERYGDVDVSSALDHELVDIATERTPDDRMFETAGEALHHLFKTTAAPNINDPTFVIDHPKSSSPLCAEHRTDPDRIERGGLWVAGMKVADTATEATDPVYQRERLAAQARRQDRDEINELLVRALARGMPPTGGLGIGIDRLAMLATDEGSVRSVMPFHP